MQIMISVDSKKQLRIIGERLREARLARNEPQARFAARIGASVPTLRKLEQGEPNVALGAFVEALWALDRLEDLDAVLAPGKSLFDRMDRVENKLPAGRKRASKRRIP
jgi:transcriptional regulator with XRE-family HTH domain